MIKIFASTDITLVGFYKMILEENGIATIVKNYYLSSGVGELPPNECIPELWIIDDNQLEKAKELLTPKNNSAWKCACGEKIDGRFSQCWKCGKMRDDT